MHQVRIGVLGAARIVPSALLAPARSVPEAVVTAIAARDQGRATAFAARHGIPRVLGDYAELIADPAIDAVYIPLPNSLHCLWTIRALQAGKHVLCEKPFASNAAEAQQMAEAAEQSGRVLMEAFHYLYHPVAQRMKHIVESGTLGKLLHVETVLCIPLPLPRDIRYRFDLAGGATMDVGAYAIHLLRQLAGQEPTVTHAQARLIAPDIDRWMTADFQFPDGLTGRMTCALLSATLMRVSARVQGELGEMVCVNPFSPQRPHRLTVRTAQGVHVAQLTRVPSYVFQLRAFVDAVLRGAPILNPPSDSIANMKVIDDVYVQAGLHKRGLTNLQ